MDSSVFCLQSAFPSLLPYGFSTSTFVKGSRLRLPIELRELIAARLSLNVCWCEIHFGHPTYILQTLGNIRLKNYRKNCHNTEVHEFIIAVDEFRIGAIVIEDVSPAATLKARARFSPTLFVIWWSCFLCVSIAASRAPNFFFSSFLT